MLKDFKEPSRTKKEKRIEVKNSTVLGKSGFTHQYLNFFSNLCVQKLGLLKTRCEAIRGRTVRDYEIW